MYVLFVLLCAIIATTEMNFI